MTYRDGNDGLRSRVEQLEQELAEARQTIARLEGKDRQGAIAEGVDWVTGAPKQAILERVIDRELTDAALEAITNLARERLPNAHVTGAGRSLLLMYQTDAIRIERTDSGAARVRLTRDPRHVRGGMAALVMLGSVFLNFPLAMYTSALLPAPLWLASIAVSFVANVIGARALVSRGQHRLRRNAVGVFEAAGELVEEFGSPMQKTRVASEPNPPEPELELEDEAVEPGRLDTLNR